MCAALFTHGIGAPHIAAAGDPASSPHSWRRCCAARSCRALAVTEPGAGSDVAALTTRAVRDGDAYVVTGAKTFITTGCRADFVTIAVRTGGPGHRGISLLVVETRAARVHRHAAEEDRLVVLGHRRTARSTRPRPVANLVGQRAPASAQIMTHFEGERLFMAVRRRDAERCVS